MWSQLEEVIGVIKSNIETLREEVEVIKSEQAVGSRNGELDERMGEPN